MASGTFRAHTNDRSFDIVVDEKTVQIDDQQHEWEATGLGPYRLGLVVDGRSVEAALYRRDDGQWEVTIDGRTRAVRVQDERALLLERFGLEDEGAGAQMNVKAPMPGLVLRVLVEEGDEVQEGDSLLVLEAMKMENELHAPGAGIVKAIHAAAGDAVGKNALLVEFGPTD